MSQIMLPPPSQPEQPPQPQAPGVYGQPYAAPPYGAPAVVAADPPGYQPEPPKQQARFWRIVKWPIRQLFKGIYLTGRAASGHKLVSAILLVIILALVGAGVVVYQKLNPTATAQTSGQGATAGAIPDTPFTIVNSAAPPLPSSVIHYLHAYKTYDGQELWNSLSPSSQQGGTASAVQQGMDRIKADGYTIQEFIYTGGYIAPDGLGTYTIQVFVRHGDQGGLLTWYFYVDPASGLILQFRDLTPGSAG